MIASLINKVYENCHKHSVDAAVAECLRLARMRNDYLTSGILLAQTLSSYEEIMKELATEYIELKIEASKFLFNKVLERYAELRKYTDIASTLTDAYDRPPKEGVLWFSIFDLVNMIRSNEHRINENRCPPGMHPTDTAYFTDQNNQVLTLLRHQNNDMQKVITRIEVFCINYASRVEKILFTQDKARSFIDGVYDTVNNYFYTHSKDDIYIKLQKINAFIYSPEMEDYSLLLTEIRRVLKSIADHFYPPNENPVICSDGKERKLNDAQYLNRIEEFINISMEKSTSKEMLGSEFNLFAAYVRKLDSLSSKGVHADVTHAEAKQGMIALYFFLHNICEAIMKKAE